MVSEEPGLWGSDTSLPEVANGSLEVLKRTILRDRNHPSIVFWLCFNECKFTEKFLADSATVCRKYDPTRRVSGANCMTNEETLYHYNKCKFDFYTMHPYSDTFKRSKTSAEILHDKPLLFSEWGGYHVYDNPHLLLDFMSEIWKVLDSFDAKDCKFTPYYTGNSGGMCDNDSIRISSYEKKDTFVLVMTNPTSEDLTDVKVTSKYPAECELLCKKEVSGTAFEVDMPAYETLFVKCKK